MRKKLIDLNNRVEITLLLAMAGPISYAVLAESPEQLILPLFLKNLLIFVPVFILDMAGRKCRSFWSYLLVSVVSLIAAGGMAWLAGPCLTGENMQWGLVFLMVAETLCLIRWYFTNRMHKHKISAAAILLFPAAYIAGLFFHNPPLCNMALFVLLFYVLLFVFTSYLERTEEFLLLHKNTKSVPRRRIYGIGRRMAAAFLLVLAIGMLPGVLLSGRRTYTNVRLWIPDIEAGLDDEETKKQEALIQKKSSRYLNSVYKELPAWLNNLIYPAEGMTAVLIVVFLYRAIRRTSVMFRATMDENGDLVENILEPEDDVKSLTGRIRRGKKSSGQDVRSCYRRTIKEHRKELPGVGETPTEIEKNAGLFEDEKMQKLHEEYELARYGEDRKGY